MTGIITRKDLDSAAETGPWRRNKQVRQAGALRQLASRSSRRFADTFAAVCNTFSPHLNGQRQNGGERL